MKNISTSDARDSYRYKNNFFQKFKKFLDNNQEKVNFADYIEKDKFLFLSFLRMILKQLLFQHIQKLDRLN